MTGISEELLGGLDGVGGLYQFHLVKGIAAEIHGGPGGTKCTINR